MGMNPKELFLMALALGLDVESIPELIAAWKSGRAAQDAGENPVHGAVHGIGSTYAGRAGGETLGELLGMPAGAILGGLAGRAMGGMGGAIGGTLAGGALGHMGGPALGRAIGGTMGARNAVNKYSSMRAFPELAEHHEERENKMASNNRALVYILSKVAFKKMAAGPMMAEGEPPPAGPPPGMGAGGPPPGMGGPPKGPPGMGGPGGGGHDPIQILMALIEAAKQGDPEALATLKAMVEGGEGGGPGGPPHPQPEGPGDDLGMGGPPMGGPPAGGPPMGAGGPPKGPPGLGGPPKKKGPPEKEEKEKEAMQNPFLIGMMTGLRNKLAYDGPSAEPKSTGAEGWDMSGQPAGNFQDAFRQVLDANGFVPRQFEGSLNEDSVNDSEVVRNARGRAPGELPATDNAPQQTRPFEQVVNWLRTAA